MAGRRAAHWEAHICIKIETDEFFGIGIESENGRREDPMREAHATLPINGVISYRDESRPRFIPAPIPNLVPEPNPSKEQVQNGQFQLQPIPVYTFTIGGLVITITGGTILILCLAPAF